MTNTLGKLELAGYIHISPDWEDDRKKCIVISPAGRKVREDSLKLIEPVIQEVVETIGVEKMLIVLPIMRDLRTILKN